jgi:hypothetical protein
MNTENNNNKTTIEEIKMKEEIEKVCNLKGGL